MQVTWFQFLGCEDPLEKEIASHSILAWTIPWIKEPGGLQSMGCRVGYNLVTKTAANTFLNMSTVYWHCKSDIHSRIVGFFLTWFSF